MNIAFCLLPLIFNNNAIQNIKQLGKVNHHNLRKYDNQLELINTIKGTNDIINDVKDLYLELFEEAKLEGPVADIVLDNPGPNGGTYDDGTDTFITGEDPNNYIWYSGKLWRAVSVNNEAKTVKLVTQWNISAINYSSGSTAFEGSYMEEWLNDTSVDGFLGNLRELS